MRTNAGCVTASPPPYSVDVYKEWPLDVLKAVGMCYSDERPLSVCISDDASMLLVGTTTGNVVLFDPRYVLLSYFVAPLGGGIYRTKDYSTDPDKYPQASPLFAKYFDCFSTLHCRPPVSHAKYLHIQTPLALTVQTQK